MKPESLHVLMAERRARRAVILLTKLSGGDRIIREGDAVEGALGEAVAKAFRLGNSTAITADGQDYFINVHLPQPRLVAIGAVHISQALAPMAKIAGFDMEIIDPRTAFATAERFPDVTLHAEWPEDVLKSRGFDPFTAVAILSHDPKIDDFPLQAALKARCFYVGALGSRKTHASRVERLRAAGLGEADIGRIRAPIGLPINAASPAEIAVAVLAEVVGALRSRGIERARDAAA